MKTFDLKDPLLEIQLYHKRKQVYSIVGLKKRILKTYAIKHALILMSC